MDSVLQWRATVSTEASKRKITCLNHCTRRLRLGLVRTPAAQWETAGGPALLLRRALNSG